MEIRPGDVVMLPVVILLGSLVMAAGYLWWRHRRWVREFDDQEAGR